ncbi:unnamed protein product [Arabidopsis arenosa]|uniref:DUF7900 domain-containing protein n=1 Tax=Arabidopsis arenosa TaxID=38785 RepID=A0A8S2A2Q1_ARAAE|nr:unnamed protein product [Arabidopsis arenosa]
MSTQSSRSDNSNKSYGEASWGRACNCGRSTIKLKAWTDDNPGRRFYKCDVHGFVSWVDVEKQCSWQKMCLLEARDEIRRLKSLIQTTSSGVNKEEDNQNLEPGNQKIEEEKKKLEGEKVKLEGEKVKLEAEKKKFEDLKKRLEDEAKVSKEREKLLRQFIGISWGGFIVAIAIIITILK